MNKKVITRLFEVSHRENLLQERHASTTRSLKAVLIEKFLISIPLRMKIVPNFSDLHSGDGAN